MPRMCVLVAMTLAVFSTCARAQARDAESQTNWQESRPALSKERQKVLVVLLDDPERRHACRVKSVMEDALICRHRLGEVAYRREEIAAVVKPHSRLGPLLWVGADFAVAAGSVTGIVLLASASTAVLVGGGIPLGVLAVAALVDAAFAIEGDCGVNAFSSAHDVVLYRSASLATAVVSR